MADRQEMLARISAALGRAKQAGAPAPLAAFSVSAKPQTDEEIADQFCAELEKVAGCVSRIDSPDGVKNYLEHLMLKDSPAQVAVSNSAVLRGVGLREWITARGSNVTPSLKEFASINKTGPDLKAVAGATGELALMESYKRALMSADIGVTAADYAIADTGTIVLIAGDEQHRLISLVPPVHVCLIEQNRIVASLQDLLAQTAIEFHKKNPPLAIVFITGPSRTADIELSLTLGVHGPRELHVLLY
jgi:L-lactate dehydrogenase complex protein LldG